MTVTNEFLKSCADKFHNAMKGADQRIVICAGTGCVANGSLDVFHALEQKINDAGLNVKTLLRYEDGGDADGRFVRLSKSGCQGFCQQGPLISINLEGVPDDILYTNVRVADVDEIVETTVKNKGIVERLLYVDRHNQNRRCRGHHDIPFYNQQHRVTLHAAAFLSRKTFMNTLPTAATKPLAESGQK